MRLNKGIEWPRFFRVHLPTQASMLMLAMTIPTAAQCAPEWELRSESGPRARQDHAMAYDSMRGVVVAHGGMGGYPYEWDLWEWNGSNWTRRPGFLERTNHAMVYDEQHDALVAFGGFESGAAEPSDETWLYQNERWSLLTTAGPRGRLDHAMAYDARRGVTVLFGGGPDAMGDTWELYPSGWRRVATTGPSRRRSHAMAFDKRRGVTVLFGGSEDPVGETWEWDGSVWTLVSTTGPGPLAEVAMCYDSNRERIVLSGGHDEFVTWEWDGLEWTRMSIGAPSGRLTLASAFDERRGKTVLFGGYSSSSGYLGDTWEYGLPNPLLIVDATCPNGGAISIRWTCATPDKTAALVYSPAHGSFTIPINQPCAGTVLDLSPAGLQLVWTGRTGHDGSGVIRTQAGPPACGSYLQFIDIDSCRVSAAVRVN